MGYVKIKIIEKGTEQDLQRWKEHMLEEPQCWNKFCFGCLDEECISAVFVKGEDDNNIYLTTLCSECIEKNPSYGILINANHMIVETHFSDN